MGYFTADLFPDELKGLSPEEKQACIEDCCAYGQFMVFTNKEGKPERVPPEKWMKDYPQS